MSKAAEKKTKNPAKDAGQVPTPPVEVVGGELCPFCNEKALTLTEKEMDIAYFGKAYLFAMHCSKCNYHKADVEPIEKHEPCKYTLDITSEEDLKIRVVKSSTATIKIPYIADITPGPDAQGYVTNVEGIINRIKHQVEVLKETEDDDEAKQKAKNLLKKIGKVLWGQEKIKMILSDPDGDSAIISEKVVKGKL
ncbi:ZPR1 zinc finger domain-containing protein [Candidatus Woesearchaeota archaeon]|nr:ZPR1 zinc finger domain-containing protein [Candidatus Woesearchaeota archaeon]